MKTRQLMSLLELGLIPQWILKHRDPEVDSAKKLRSKGRETAWRLASVSIGFCALIAIRFAVGILYEISHGHPSPNFGWKTCTATILIILAMAFIIYWLCQYGTSTDSYFNRDEPILHQIAELAKAMEVEMRVVLGLSVEEAQDQARETLIKNAFETIYCEGRYGTIDLRTEQARDAFKQHHKLFVKLELVSGEWNQYFEQAKARVVSS